MNLKEYQGKEIFSKNGIKVPNGFVVSDIAQIKEKISSIKDKCVVKAQVLTGGRGKAGGVKLATKENANEIAGSILGMSIKGLRVNEVLIEERMEIQREIYVSIAINRAEKGLTLIVSLDGGVDIEELSSKHPEKIIKLPINEIDEGKIREKIRFEHIDELIEIIKRLRAISEKYDAELVEINPLALTPKGLIAADSKIIIDDNALFRHPEYIGKKKEQLTDIEKQANEIDIQYVELDGDIAIIGNGAGLVMATLDVIAHYGGRAANFLDVGGGASVEQMEKSLEICMLKKPKGIFVNIFGGITRCDYIAQGLVSYIKKNSLGVPMVVRLIGTNEKEGQAILKNAGIASLSSMEECAQKIVELSKCQ